MEPHLPPIGTLHVASGRALLLDPPATAEDDVFASLDEDALLALPGQPGWHPVGDDVFGRYTAKHVELRVEGESDPFVRVAYTDLMRASLQTPGDTETHGECELPRAVVQAATDLPTTEPSPWLSIGDLWMRYNGMGHIEFKTKEGETDLMFVSRDVLVNALSLYPTMGEFGSLIKVAAKYKQKKKVKPKGGEERTVYLYSEKQIQHRNRQKAKRVERLSKKIGDLRAKVKRDMRSSDPEKVLTALAVALMDHTYERVGNDGSADDGHFGVTGWLKKHVSFGKGKATIKYVGKSGVKQDKKVTDASIVKALRDAYEAVEGDEGELFSWEGGKVNAEKVNAYLKDFDVTAKDIRGYHANEEMRTRLKEKRKAGGALPEDKKKREKKLKDEFKAALEEAAEAVGHEPSTLRSQYLVPGLEEGYVEDGKIMEKFTKSAEDGVGPVWW